MRTLFRIGRRKAVALLLATTVLGVSYVAWERFGLGGLMVVTLVTLLAGIGILGFMVAAAERRIRGEVAFFAYTTRDLIREIDEKSVRPGEHDEALLRALNASNRRLEEELVQRLRESRH